MSEKQIHNLSIAKSESCNKQSVLASTSPKKQATFEIILLIEDVNRFGL